MTSTISLSLPRFLPLRSFMAYAVGEEKIEVSTNSFVPTAGVVESRKAA